jgi:hypothetical protein
MFFLARTTHGWKEEPRFASISAILSSRDTKLLRTRPTAEMTRPESAGLRSAGVYVHAVPCSAYSILVHCRELSARLQ